MKAGRKTGAGADIFEGTTRLLRDGLGMFMESFRQTLSERRELVVADMLGAQEPVQAVDIADGPQTPAEKQAVVAFENTNDAVGMTIKKSLHGQNSGRVKPNKLTRIAPP